MISLLIMSRANEESKTKSLRICSAYENKRNNGHSKKITSLCPAWFEYDRETDLFKLNKFASIVKEIFQLSIHHNMGSVAIAKHLNNDPVKYPPLNKKTGFNHGYVKKILNSKATYGTNEVFKLGESGRRVKVSEIENYYPAVITFEEYQLSQSRIQQRKVSGNKNNGSGMSNIFQSLIKCYCGATVIFTNSYALDKFYPYLLCANAKKGMCDASKWRYDTFEKLFFVWMKEINFDEIFSNNDNVKNKIIDSITLLEQDHYKSNIEYNNIINIIAGVTNSTIVNDLILKAESIKNEQGVIESRIKTLNAELLSFKVEVNDSLKQSISQLTTGKPESDVKVIRNTIRHEIIKLISSIKFNNDGMVFESGQYMFDEIPDVVLDIVNKRGYKTDEEKEKYLLSDAGGRLLNDYTRTFTVNFKNGVFKNISKNNIHSNEACVWLRNKKLLLNRN